MQLSALQVCTDIHEGNRSREINGLKEVCHAIDVKGGYKKMEGSISL